MTRFFIFLYLLLHLSICREHKFQVRNEDRNKIRLTTFGFLNPGLLYVNLSSLTFNKPSMPSEPKMIGFSLDRADNAGISPYIEQLEDNKCIFTDDSKSAKANIDTVFITLNGTKKNALVERHGSKVIDLKFYRLLNHVYRNQTEFRSNQEFNPPENKVLAQEIKLNDSKKLGYVPQNLTVLPLNVTKGTDGNHVYDLVFVMYVSGEPETGLYNLYFHNCANLKSTEVLVSFDIHIIEKNGRNYLTAFEMPLPTLYLTLSAAYFALSIIWLTILKKSDREAVYKIHYLMLLLVFFKSLSLLVHAIEYHFISLTGQSHTTWAVLFYITYVIRGLLLFTVLVLIGSGWQLMKHVFSANEKRVFVLVLTLQVVTNVAYVLKESSEEGAERHEMWQQVFILVDLICCGAVLFPIVWSIRHLQHASTVDGKGATNLAKLKLFRHFYVTIVCYIYFTRIVVYLLRIVVPFQYRWLGVLSTEMATMTFFIVTAYTFRPTFSNPYMRLSLDSDEENEDFSQLHSGAEHRADKVAGHENDDDDEEAHHEEVVTTSFAADQSVRRNKSSSPSKPLPKSIV